MFHVNDIIYWKDPHLSGTWQILRFHDKVGTATLKMLSQGVSQTQEIGHILNHWPIEGHNQAILLSKGRGKSHPLTDFFKD